MQKKEKGVENTDYPLKRIRKKAKMLINDGVTLFQKSNRVIVYGKLK